MHKSRKDAEIETEKVTLSVRTNTFVAFVGICINKGDCLHVLPTDSVLLRARKLLAWRAAFGSSITSVVDLCLHSLEVSLLTTTLLQHHDVHQSRHILIG